MYRKPAPIAPGLPADGILRLADNAHIPADPRNTDWQAYQAWLAAGNAPDAPDAAAPPPKTA